MPKSHAFSSPTLQAEAFINESLSKASWLIRNLDRRADSILKVATEIVRHQEAFFEHGVFHLRPLDLKTIANAIGVHESTVSRVTSNKYMQPDLNTACENMSLSQHVRRAPARVTTTFWGDLRRVVRRGCVAERCQLP
ncbi:RNA polymerase factor sigma-54 [Mesorhizobium sp. USDA 4775]